MKKENKKSKSKFNNIKKKEKEDFEIDLSKSIFSNKDINKKENYFEKDLRLMDENYKNGLFIESNYEPSFSINYPNQKISSIPLFTPSTRLNNALQIGEKSDSFIFYYTHKKSLYPTIYNQLIGISGPNSPFFGKEKDFIYANAKSLIFTNQKNFINLKNLLKEYVEPLMKDNSINEELQNNFIQILLKNILIHEYLTYEELFVKIIELNIYLKEHKINNVGLIIIDGINTINPQKVEFINENGNIKFYKFSNKIEQNPEKKNSTDKKNKKKKSVSYYDNSTIKQNLYGNNYTLINNNNSKIPSVSNEIIQQNIVSLIMNYQKKYNFNLIITVFDYTQDNFYNLNFSGKASYKEMNKNTYNVNNEELQKENCYFSFKLPKIAFPKKIMFIEPINLCLNYNQNIFGLITNPINTQKLEFQVFKKEKNDYRPTRILSQIEYEFK